MKKLTILLATALVAFSCESPTNEQSSKFITVTFEDAAGENYWNSMIDTEQYDGDLLYDNEDGYIWVDEATSLQGGMVDTDFWSGGDVISNYANTDYAGVNFNRQLEVPFEAGKGGNKGSQNFGMHYLMAGAPGEYWSSMLPTMVFSDGVARTFDHIYVAPASALLESVMNGDGQCGPYKTDELENEYIKFRFTGYDENEMRVGSVEIDFLDESKDYVLTDWTKVDLSSLGKIWGLAIDVYGNNQGSWGFNRPAYVAFDDIAILKADFE